MPLSIWAIFYLKIDKIRIIHATTPSDGMDIMHLKINVNGKWQANKS